MELSEKIKALRLKMLLSQQEMAKELGVSFASINRWENGHNVTNFSQQRTFNKYFKKYKVEE